MVWKHHTKGRRSAMKIAVDVGGEKSCWNCGEIPKMSCPKCGKEYDDFDGLSFSYCPACGYCSHPAIDGNDDKLICGVCGREVKRIPVGNGIYKIIEVENENSN
jgi:DNA-directed RNA polymerase subunit M/transcription elongation factor TFIIS